MPSNFLGSGEKAGRDYREGFGVLLPFRAFAFGSKVLVQVQRLLVQVLIRKNLFVGSKAFGSGSKDLIHF